MNSGNARPDEKTFFPQIWTLYPNSSQPGNKEASALVESTDSDHPGSVVTRVAQWSARSNKHSLSRTLNPGPASGMKRHGWSDWVPGTLGYLGDLPARIRGPIQGSYSAMPPPPVMGNRSLRSDYRQHACSLIPGRRSDIPGISTAKQSSDGRISSASVTAALAVPPPVAIWPGERIHALAPLAIIVPDHGIRPGKKDGLAATLRPTNEIGRPSARRTDLNNFTFSVRPASPMPTNDYPGSNSCTHHQ